MGDLPPFQAGDRITRKDLRNYTKGWRKDRKRK
jgi:hypothetical protein